MTFSLLSIFSMGFLYSCRLSLCFWSSHGCLPEQVWNSHRHHIRLFAVFSCSCCWVLCKKFKPSLHLLQLLFWNGHKPYLCNCNNRCISLLRKKKICCPWYYDSGARVRDNDSWPNFTGISGHVWLEEHFPCVCRGFSSCIIDRFLYAQRHIISRWERTGSFREV